MKCVMCKDDIKLTPYLEWFAEDLCRECAYDRWNELIGILPKPPSVETGSAGRTLGVEIEINTSIKSLYRAWSGGAKIVTDGSLRGNAAEIVSPVLREDAFDDWVMNCVDGAKNIPYDRQGLHLWVGCKDLSWFELKTLMEYCKKWEEVFFSLVSPSRLPKDRHSGRPLKLEYKDKIYAYNKRQFVRFLYGTDPEKLSSMSLGGPRGMSAMKFDSRCNCYNGPRYQGPISRYWWMNIHGFFHRRALEIRLHHGTTSGEKIIRWKDLWVDLIPKISKPVNANVNPFRLMTKTLHDYYVARADFYKDMEGYAGERWGVVETKAGNDIIRGE